MIMPNPLRYPSALVFAASALFAAGGAAAAATPIYECTDARGAREYTQVCPAGTVSRREVLHPEDVPAGVPETKSPALQDAEFRKRQQERQDADAKAAADRAKAEEADRNCTQARAQLKALVEGQRMQRIEPETGARINLGDDERAADAEQQKKLVEQWCKKPE
jgi:hypothetical protein